MIDDQTKITIKQLHQRGTAIREISRLMRVSRNTVRRCLNPPTKHPQPTKLTLQSIISMLPDLYSKTKGNAIRIQELLLEQGYEIAYSTLTGLIRNQGLRQPPKLSGVYTHPPGQEMQHDTSPHKLKLNHKIITAQCAGVILSFSKKCFIQYYPCFTRFEAQVFLNEAIQFLGYSCRDCIIDNTSVILASGSGAHAQIAPSMAAFGEFFGMTFLAHEIRHADRKANIERLFHYAENNFLAAREFRDWQDLNQQAKHWCTYTANGKKKRSLKNETPDAVFDQQEKAHMLSIPNFVPPVYQVFHRTVDSQGYIHLDTNRYSVPERLLNKQVKVLKYFDKVDIYFEHKSVALHPRCLDGKHQRFTLEGHHVSATNRNKKTPSSYENALLGVDVVLDQFIHALKVNSPGRGTAKLKRLLNFKRLYPWEPFLKAITQANHYHLYDLSRIENMILDNVSSHFFNLEDELND